MNLNGETGEPQRTDGRNQTRLLGVGSTGEAAVLVIGEATDDTGIVAEIGADANYADGSLYVSAVNGAGKLFQKVNDVWTQIS